jgi:hypothetical protein
VQKGGSSLSKPEFDWKLHLFGDRVSGLWDGKLEELCQAAAGLKLPDVCNIYTCLVHIAVHHPSTI